MISSGTFGKVYSGMYGADEVAVKVVEYTERIFDKKRVRFLQYVFREVDVLQLCSDQDNICNLVGVCFESNSRALIVMEKYDYTLKDYLLNCLPNAAIRKDFAMQCVDFIRCLVFKLKFIHADIKSNNILVKLSKYGTPKLVLADMGNVCNLYNGDIFLSPQRETRTWRPSTYQCNRKANTSNGDMSVDLFAMMYVLMEIVYGRSKIVNVAKKEKKVDFVYGAHAYGPTSMHFLKI